MKFLSFGVYVYVYAYVYVGESSVNMSVFCTIAIYHCGFSILQCFYS